MNKFFIFGVLLMALISVSAVRMEGLRGRLSLRRNYLQGKGRLQAKQDDDNLVPIDDLVAFVKEQFQGLDSTEITGMLEQLSDVMGLEGELRDALMKNPLHVTSFIDRVGGCANSNTYLVNAAKYIQQSGLVDYITRKPKSEVKTTIQMATVYAFLLDTLTTRAIHDTKFFERMFNTIWTNIQRSNYQFNTFQTAKLYSVYAGLKLVLGELKNQQASNSYANSIVLPVNVMEAVMQDRHMGFYDNADAGVPLATFNPTDTYNRATGSGPRSLSSDGKIVEMHYPLGLFWDDLYSTWNMGFVSHYANYPFYFAKLMTPAVGCYHDHPEQYIFRRGVALYLHVCFSAHTTNKHIHPFSTIDWFNEELSKGFGLINKASSEDYSARVIALDPTAQSRSISVIDSIQKKVSLAANSVSEFFF